MKIIELLESRSAPLYHTTSYTQLFSILKENKLKGNTKHTMNDKQYQGVSLTRDLDFAKWWSREQLANVGIILQLDQNKLRQRYKIMPIDYFQTTAQEDPAFGTSEKLGFEKKRRTNIYAEAEEFLIANEISNLDQYIQAILLPQKSADKIDTVTHSAQLPREKAEEYLSKFEFILKQPKLRII